MTQGNMNIDFLHTKFMIASIITAIATPNIENFMRFLIPIVSGVAWIFLKPVIEKHRTEIVKKIKAIWQKIKFWKTTK